jgi:hypothetical protein
MIWCIKTLRDPVGFVVDQSYLWFKLQTRKTQTGMRNTGHHLGPK